MKVIVFYHNDLDGQCSAHVINRVFGGISQIKFVAVNYRDEVDFSIISSGDKVVVVDYSFSLKDFQKIGKRTSDIVWIDHHKSAIEKFKGTVVEKLEGIRESDKGAGCMLTWDYYYPKSTPPDYIQLISDYDTWNFKEKERPHMFKLGMDTLDTCPTAEVWELVFGYEHRVKEILRRGQVVYDYTQKLYAEILEDLGYEVTFEGYKCIVCNAEVNSFLFRDKLENYDMGITFTKKEKDYTVSLYSVKNSIDCSKVATKYGGGGHKGASGFVTQALPWE